MRWSSLAVAVWLTGCAHAPATPESITSFAGPPSSPCAPLSDDDSFSLTVQNKGPGKLRISAQHESRPPFRMGWPYYAVLSGRVDPPAAYQQPTGHANLPIAHVSIGPGDSTQFLLYLGERTPVSAELRYRAQFEDESGQVHYSLPFSLCVPGSMPNNSSKPTPLRGAA